MMQTAALVQLLQSCSSSQRADVQLNVVSALGQLSRDQEVTAQALLQPQGKGSHKSAMLTV